MKIKSFRMHTAFQKLLVSYVVIFLIPVLIGAFSYIKIGKTTNEDVRQYNEVLMQQMQGVVDNYISEVDSIRYQISIDPMVNTFVSAGDVNDLLDTMQLVDLQSTLKRFKMSNNYIYDIYLYFGAEDVLITTSMKTNSHSFFNNTVRYVDYTYETWKQTMLEGYFYQYYFKSMPIDSLPNQKNVITYVQSLPINNPENIGCQLVILLNADQMMEVIQKNDKGAVFIVDERNTIIASTKNDQIPVEPILQGLGKPADTFEYNADGVDYIVTYTMSRYNNWSYISAMPKNIFLQKVIDIERGGFLILLVYLLIASMIIYYFMNSNYRPIRGVLSEIKKLRGITLDKNMDEFALIRQEVIASSINENKLQAIIKKQSDIVKRNYLVKLMRGEVYAEQDVAQTLSSMGMRFVSDHFVILLVSIAQGGAFLAEDSEQVWLLARFAVENITEELAGEQNVAYAIELDKQRVAVILNLHTDRQANYKEDADVIAVTLADVLRDEFDISVSVGVSACHAGSRQLADCYREAVAALDSRLLYKDARILYFDEVCKSPAQETERCSYYYPLEIENKLMNYIGNCDYESICKVLDSVFASNMQRFTLTMELKRCLYYEIFGTYMKALNKYQIDYTEVAPNQSEAITALLESDTAEKLLLEIKEMYRNLCEHVGRHASDRNRRIMEHIEEYVNLHYMDNGLCLNSIADLFGMTPQYLSALFKQSKGMGLVDYIGHVRVEQGKRLLQDHTLTVFQIANMVGYSNDVGFSRLFKKYEGITPGKYRESL